MSTSTNVRPQEDNPWVSIRVPRSNNSIRLFCFPYAGGSSMIYRNWSSILPENYEVCSIRLPGRESRMMESPFTSLDPLIDSLTDAIIPYLDKPFVFFGHSMGAKIAFELARSLRKKAGLEPLHLFVSGSPAPQIPRTRKNIFDLPEADFIEELRLLDGTPKEVLQHPELMQLIMPILRADFELVQTYSYKPGLRLRCPITAFGGTQDHEVNRESLEAWSKESAGPFSLRMVAGNHFFINTARFQLLSLVAQELQRIFTRRARASAGESLRQYVW